MPSPFPGMDPYLEHPDRWSGVHNRLIVALADFLTPKLLPTYQVEIEKRIYEVMGANTLLVGRPDATVQRVRVPVGEIAPQETSSGLTFQPIQVTVPMLEEVREAYLEVKDAATQDVITAIEILSPTNKRGDGRQKYEKKRQQILSSRPHLVEIDLLRDGIPMAVNELPSSHYRILVSRSEHRPVAALYPFNLADPIPNFPLPLRPGDGEPVVQLGDLLNQVYDHARYDVFIDYHADPWPALGEAEQAWLDDVLHQQGLR